MCLFALALNAGTDMAKLNRAKVHVREPVTSSGSASAEAEISPTYDQIMRPSQLVILILLDLT